MVDTCILLLENRVLTRIIGPKREEVTGGWRKLCSLCSKKHHDLCCLLYGGSDGQVCGIMVKRRNTCKVLVGKPGRKRQLNT